MEANSQLVELLGRVPLFEGLSKKGLKRVIEMAGERQYQAGEEITAQDTKGARFHLILDGSAKVVVNGRTRRRLTTGDTLGEIALIDGRPRTATVVADTPVTTLSIASWNFRGLLREEPDVAEKVMIDLARRVRELEKQESV